MSNIKKISDCLKKNSKDEYVSNLLNEILALENQGLHHYKDKYDECIEKYYKRGD